LGTQGNHILFQIGGVERRAFFVGRRQLHGWTVRSLADRKPCLEMPGCGSRLFRGRNHHLRELDGRANGLAQILVEMGVVPDTVVAVHLERSIGMVVTLLAILKAGGAYVYLDPNYPPYGGNSFSRTRSQSPSSPARVSPSPRVCESGRMAGRELTAAFSSNRPAGHGVEPGSLAYLTYTSGSTGTPKAVAMPHRVLCNLLEWQITAWTAPAPARTLQFSSLNFDVSFQEIFSTLYAGGTLLLITEEQRLDPFLLFARPARHGRRAHLSALYRTPASGGCIRGRAHSAPAPAGRYYRGEQLQITPQLRAFFASAHSCTLHDQYGPAETMS